MLCDVPVTVAHPAFASKYDPAKKGKFPSLASGSVTSVGGGSSRVSASAASVGRADNVDGALDDTVSLASAPSLLEQQLAERLFNSQLQPSLASFVPRDASPVSRRKGGLGSGASATSSLGDGKVEVPASGVASRRSSASHALSADRSMASSVHAGSPKSLSSGLHLPQSVDPRVSEFSAELLRLQYSGKEDAVSLAIAVGMGGPHAASLRAAVKAAAASKETSAAASSRFGAPTAGSSGTASTLAPPAPTANRAPKAASPKPNQRLVSKAPASPKPATAATDYSDDGGFDDET